MLRHSSKFQGPIKANAEDNGDDSANKLKPDSFLGVQASDGLNGGDGGDSDSDDDRDVDGGGNGDGDGEDDGAGGDGNVDNDDGGEKKRWSRHEVMMERQVFYHILAIII